LVDLDHRSNSIIDRNSARRNMIKAEGLAKRFGKVTALAGVDLSVDSGEVVAVLGPNGAGKTTFVRILSTLITPDGGTLEVYGRDVRRDSAAVRASIGLAGQHAAVEATMTGRENLEMVGALYGLRAAVARRRAVAVIDRLSLADVADRLTRTYSGGERRRLDLGASLVGSPRLLVLDEPTTGLDPRSRLELWDCVRELTNEGTDVMLTTQNLEEADRLASRIVIIDRGKVIADGSPSALKARAGRDVVEVHIRHPAELALTASVMAGAAGVAGAHSDIDVATRRVSVAVANGSEAVSAIAQRLRDAAVSIEDLQLRGATLEEVFLAITAKPDSNNERKSA
jgi:ABC-2 type transport system ATP-binding protein